MNPARRNLLLSAPLLLTGCGFALRQAPRFGFRSIYLALPYSSALGLELRRQLQGTGNVQVIADAAQRDKERPRFVERLDFEIATILTMGFPGYFREFQLRIRFRFRLFAADGRELLPMSEILRQIDQSYSESAALSKEQEALMLYQNMQSDIVQQVMRRLGTVKP